MKRKDAGMQPRLAGTNNPLPFPSLPAKCVKSTDGPAFFRKKYPIVTLGKNTRPPSVGNFISLAHIQKKKKECEIQLFQVKESERPEPPSPLYLNQLFQVNKEGRSLGHSRRWRDAFHGIVLGFTRKSADIIKKSYAFPLVTLGKKTHPLSSAQVVSISLSLFQVDFSLMPQFYSDTKRGRGYIPGLQLYVTLNQLQGKSKKRPIDILIWVRQGDTCVYREEHMVE